MSRVMNSNYNCKIIYTEFTKWWYKLDEVCFVYKKGMGVKKRIKEWMNWENGSKVQFTGQFGIQ